MKFFKSVAYSDNVFSKVPVLFLSLTVLATIFLFLSPLSAADPGDISQRPALLRVSGTSDRMQVIQAVAPRLSTWKGRGGGAIKSRRIGVNPEMMRRQQVRQGENLSLHLFEDTQVDAVVERSVININGTTITSAKIEGSQWGRVFIASTDGILRAKIHVPEEGKFYAIQHNEIDDEHYSLELDPAHAQFDGVGIPAPVSEDNPGGWPLPEMAEDEATDATAVVDVMVVYSNDALTDSGSVAEVNNHIALGMAFANDAHSNTNSGIYLNLVHAAQVSYDGSDSRSIDLTRLTSTNDGYIDDVHTLRNTYGADFVVLMVGDYTSDGGIAWVLQSTNGSSSYAFSVVTEPAFESYTPVHEIGHNMGLSHAKDQNYQAGPTNWVVDAHGFDTTTAGWHWHPTPGSSGYCSVMTYTAGIYFDDGLSHTRVGLFSDPAIMDHGMASGDAVNGDSARVLRAMKNVYAGYRDRVIAANSIVVDYPSGGESWKTGNSHTIQWDSNGVAGNVKIELYKDGVFNRVIDASTLNDRIYSWSVPAGINGYNYTIRISNLTDTIEAYSGEVTIREMFYDEQLNSNPGYSITGAWGYGAPQPNNTANGGPGEAYSGTNIYDTNLNGVSTSTGLLTTTAIDCSDYSGVQLLFMGWFSMYTGYTARVEVSNDGSNWHEIYARDGSFYASVWSNYSFDISAYADNESTVYVRWIHDDVAGGGNFSGMSVDDIQLIGIEDGTSVSFTDGASFSVTAPDADSVNNVLGRFYLQAAQTGATLNEAAIDVSGTHQGVNNYKLWSSVDSNFNAGADTELDSRSDGAIVSFASFSSPVSTGGTYYFITTDLGVSAEGSISLSLGSQADLSLVSGILDTTFTNAPLSSGSATINAAVEMNIRGNNVTIADGDGSPTPSDFTEFGGVDITSGSVVHSFTIENLGAATLNLTDISPYVTISGHTSDFLVTQTPANHVSGGGTTTFAITFNPIAEGTRTATISIANDDSNENPYNFTIEGTGTVSPEINVRGNGITIIDGDSSPALSDHTNFGSLDIVDDLVVHTFTIENTGLGALNLTGPFPYVDISGDATDFAVTALPSNSIVPSGSTTFSINFDPTVTGTRSATISIANDDSDENPYFFIIEGAGTDPPAVATNTVGSITSVSADLTGSITDLGYPYPHAHGFVWNTTGVPDLSDESINLGTISSTTTIGHRLTGLSGSTTYYARAYATSSMGTVYGNTVVFTTEAYDGDTCFPIQSQTGRVVMICF